MPNGMKRMITLLFVASSLFVADRAHAQADDAGFARLYREAQSALSAGKDNDARTAFEQLEKMDPSVAEVHATLAALCYKHGDFNRSIEEVRTARKLKPTLPGLDALLSMSLAESGNFREALPGLEKAYRSASDPEQKRQAGLELARVYGQLSMDRRAAELVLDLRDRYKDDPEVLYNAGKILGNSAYLTMQSLFRAPGGSLWAQLAEAEAHESQGQLQDARDSYRNILERDPHRVNIHYRIGRTFLAQWQSTHAAEDLTNAAAEFALEIEDDPANANAAYELAGLRWKAGQQVAAQQLYESAIKYYPDFEEAEVGLGGILLDEEKAPLALPHLKRATVLRPQDEVAWYRLAQVEHALGDAQAQKQALAAFQKLRAHSAATRNSAMQSQDNVTPQEIGVEAPTP